MGFVALAVPTVGSSSLDMFSRANSEDKTVFRGVGLG